MQRRASFLLSHIFLWFAVANGVESLPTLQDQCLEFDIADLEGYVSTFDLAKVPTVDAMFAGFEYPITGLPFGFLRSDWTRLLLLRNSQPTDTILVNKLERLFRVLIVAYLKMERALVPSTRVNETTDGKPTTLEGSVFDTSTTVSGNIRNVDKNRGDMKERGNGSEQENLLETVTIEFNRNDRYNVTASSSSKAFAREFTTTNFWYSKIKSLPSSYVNNLTANANVTMTMRTVTSNEDANGRITNVAKNEKDRDASTRISTPMNIESTSSANSISTRKSYDFGTSTEKFRYLEGQVSRTTETERTTNPTINFDDSHHLEGNRNIEDSSFTTLTDGSTMSTKTSSNEGTDLNGFDTEPAKIKHEGRFEVSLSKGVDTSTASITKLPEKSDEFDTSMKTSTNDASDSYNFNVSTAEVTINDGSDTSTKFSIDLIPSTSSETFASSDGTNFTRSVNTEENIKANSDHGFAGSTEAFAKSARTGSSVNDVTNRSDLKGTTSMEVSTWKKNNPDYKPNVGKNSIDYTDPSVNSVYDVFGSEPDSDIDESRIIGNKLKRLPVSREQLPGNIMNNYKETVQRDLVLVSKKTTRSSSSMENANESTEYFSGPRKRAQDNTNIENNFKFFYNLGEGGPRKIIRINDGDILHFIRIQCRDETT